MKKLNDLFATDIPVWKVPYIMTDEGLRQYALEEAHKLLKNKEPEPPEVFELAKKIYDWINEGNMPK